MAKYDTPEANEWVQPIMKGYKLACCDCGLVHEVDFRFISINGKAKLQMRFRRANRSTAQIRRHKDVKLVKK
jgi:hypothetical protein